MNEYIPVLAHMFAFVERFTWLSTFSITYWVLYVTVHMVLFALAFHLYPAVCIVRAVGSAIRKLYRIARREQPEELPVATEMVSPEWLGFRKENIQPADGAPVVPSATHEWIHHGIPYSIVVYILSRHDRSLSQCTITYNFQ